MYTRRILTKQSMYLLGVGAAAGGALGVYLYKSPRLRKQMQKADTVKEAAHLLTDQIRKDSAVTANKAIAAMSEEVADKLRHTRSVLGKRFFGMQQKATIAKAGARHIKNEAKHIGRTAKTQAHHVAATARNEATRMKDEALEARDLIEDEMAQSR